MTRYKMDNTHFGCRAAGVILHDNHILLQGEPQGTIWTLPGGGIKLNEPSTDALRREMREELQVEIEIERLLWIVEQFYVTNGETNHEIGFYFHTMLLDAAHLYTLEYVYRVMDGNNDILFKWFKLEQLGTITLYPTFLPTALQSLPTSPEHIVIIETP